MNKYLGYIAITTLASALLVYSASRSLDFIALTLPQDRQALAWVGLAALDGGLVAWLVTYLFGARGGAQRAIALVMIVCDLLGAVAIFTADTLYNTGKAGLTATMTPGAIYTAVLALSLIVAINIAATVAFHLTEPEALRNQAEEAARAKIEDAILMAIRDNAGQLAAEIAPKVSRTWKDQMTAEYSHRIKVEKLPALPQPEMELLANPISPRSRGNSSGKQAGGSK
jgi:streptogramin lyase